MDGPLWVAGHGEDWSENTKPWCGQWGPRKCLQGSHQSMGLGHVLGGDVQGKQAPLLALLHQPQPSVLVSVVLKPWQPTPAWNIAYAGLKQDGAGKAQQREIEWNTKLETHIIKTALPSEKKKQPVVLHSWFIVFLHFSSSNCNTFRPQSVENLLTLPDLAGTSHQADTQRKQGCWCSLTTLTSSYVMCCREKSKAFSFLHDRIMQRFGMVGTCKII